MHDTRPRRLGLAFVVAVAAVIGAGCGAVPSVELPILTGRADVNGDGTGLSIETADWTYGGDFGFAWVDGAGSLHTGGRPDCLAPGASTVVRFAAPEVIVDGGRLRPIVWLDCRGVP